MSEQVISTDENSENSHIYASEKCKREKSDGITIMKNNDINVSISSERQLSEIALTPELKVKNNMEKPQVNSEISSNVEQHLYGPVLPEHLRNSMKGLDDDESKANNLCDSSFPYSGENKRILGPEIPNDLFSTISSQQEENSDIDESYGPSTSLMARSSDEMSSISSKSFISLQKESNSTTVKRESWMLELPSRGTAALKIGPRQFKTRLPDENNDDRSIWTETPANKARKQNQIDSKDYKDIMRLKQMKEKDRMLEKLIKKTRKKKKREESLLEIHRRKIKKKAKKEAAKRENEKKPVERRPFDRNIDLQVNRFDFAQKKAIINKAQMLNNRFQQGESKYL